MNKRLHSTQFALLALALGCTSLLRAQPVITGVGNGADFSATVAPGSLASVFGTGLASSPASPSALPFPTTFNGVSITIGGRPAPLTYVSPTQINFQVPSAVAIGNATLSVTSAGRQSGGFSVSVAAAAPGIFQYGANRAIVQNQDYSLNAAANPANTGSTVIVYLTGIGATSPAVADGTAAPASPLAVPTAKAFTATVAGYPATVQFLGLTPGNVGLAQANLAVPELPSGDYPVTITMNGITSKTAQISVRSNSNLTGTPSSAFPPPGPNCVSGRVDTYTYSQQNSLTAQADAVTIGGVPVCKNCAIRPPLHGPLNKQLADAIENGLSVDACYDQNTQITLVRVRQ